MKNHGLTCKLTVDNNQKELFQTSESNVIIKDEQGDTVHAQPFRSFTANYLRMLWGNALGKNTTTAIKDIDGSDVDGDAFTTYKKFFLLGDDAGVYNSGLCVGSGTSDVTQEDYTLTFLTDLTYYATSTGTKTTTASSVKLPINRTIKNDTASTITISELGIVVNSVLIAREKLTSSVTISAGSARDITINLVYGFDSATGGFVNDWVDLFNTDFTFSSYTADYSSRLLLNAVVFNDKLYVFSGASGSSVLSDVWESTDGKTWTETSSSSLAVAQSAVIEMNGTVYAISGTTTWPTITLSNATYKTTDMINWTLVTTTTSFTARRFAWIAKKGTDLYVYSGLNIGNSRLLDVWKSSDYGGNWTQQTADALSITSPTIQKFYCDDTDFYIVANSKKYKSTDDCVTFSYVEDVNIDNVNMYPTVFGDLAFNGSTSNNLYVYDSVISTSITTGCTPVFFKNNIVLIGQSATGAATQHSVYIFSPTYNIIANGVKAGTSSDAFDVTDTALTSEIEEGTDTNELNYGDSDNLTNSEPTVSGDTCKMTLTRTLSNNSSASIAIGEIGIESGKLWCRIIPEESIGIKNGESKTISLEFSSEV